MSNTKKSRNKDDWKHARNEFSQTVGKSVNLLMESHGYSRDRAIDLVLREIGGPSLVTDEAALNKLKQQYRLAHQPAARALIVSTAFEQIAKPLARRNDDSHVESVYQLIKTLEKATFTSNPDSILNESEIVGGKNKGPEIRLAQISKSKPVIVVPTSSSSSNAKSTQRAKTHSSPNNKRSKSAASTGSSKTNKTKARKRTMEEISSSKNSQQTAVAEETGTRPRSDSVTEAVSAKLKQPQAPAEVKPNSNSNAVRGKRTRGSSSLDEESSTKRARPAAAK